jgi:NAD+ synthase
MKQKIITLLKFQIKKLAKVLNIPQAIIDKIPTAGLWPGQTDKAELGISYSKLDDILLRLSNRQKQRQPKVVVNKVKSRIKASEHKRQLPQICKI